MDISAIFLTSRQGKQDVGRKVAQRDCQARIVESADQLASDGIIGHEIRDYLQFIQQ